MPISFMAMDRLGRRRTISGTNSASASATRTKTEMKSSTWPDRYSPISEKLNAQPRVTSHSKPMAPSSTGYTATKFTAVFRPPHKKVRRRSATAHRPFHEQIRRPSGRAFRQRRALIGRCNRRPHLQDHRKHGGHQHGKAAQPEQPLVEQP